MPSRQRLPASFLMRSPMDVESPEHLERLRDLKPIKVALLVFRAGPSRQVARFERTARNPDYWPFIEAVHAQIAATGAAQESCTSITVYGQPCWLICTLNAPRPDSHFSLAVVSAEGADLENVVTRLRAVCQDYWYGSSFFK